MSILAGRRPRQGTLAANAAKGSAGRHSCVPRSACDRRPALQNINCAQRSGVFFRASRHTRSRQRQRAPPCSWVSGRSFLEMTERARLPRTQVHTKLSSPACHRRSMRTELSHAGWGVFSPALVIPSDSARSGGRGPASRWRHRSRGGRGGGGDDERGSPRRPWGCASGSTGKQRQANVGWNASGKRRGIGFGRAPSRVRDKLS